MGFKFSVARATTDDTRAGVRVLMRVEAFFLLRNSLDVMIRVFAIHHHHQLLFIITGL